MCTARLFSHGVDLLALKIIPRQGGPHQPFLAPEYLRHWATRRWRRYHSAFPRFDTIPQCNGQTDGRIWRSIHSACKASFATRCKNARKQEDARSVGDYTVHVRWRYLQWQLID